MATGDTVIVKASFQASSDIPYKTFLFMEPVITTANGTVVSGGDAARLIVRDEEIATHKTDLIELDITSDGNLGFADEHYILPFTDYVGSIGNGLVVEGNSIIAHAGVLVGDAGRVATSIGKNANRYPFWNQDFEAVTPMQYEVDGNDIQYSQVSYRTRKLRLGITQQTMVDPFFANNIVLLRYIVHNESSRDLTRCACRASH